MNFNFDPQSLFSQSTLSEKASISWYYHSWAQQAKDHRFSPLLWHASPQHENNGAGLHMWDAAASKMIQSCIILALSTADALGMTETNGCIGHHGTHGCRLGCPMKGRHKPHTGHYFALHLRPNNYLVHNCNHPDVDIHNLHTLLPVDYQRNLSKVVASTDQTDYEKNCKETGIGKPGILSGLVNDLMFPVPHCFPLDLMHLLFINLGEPLIPLWQGTMKCDTTDDPSQWERKGTYLWPNRHC